MTSSLFDELFKLKNTAPETDVDPEDPLDGFGAKLVEGFTEAEALGTTALRKQAAIIEDDPRYQGKKTSRKDLFSDDEDEGHGSVTSDKDSKASDSDSNEEENDESNASGEEEEDEESNMEDDDDGVDVASDEDEEETKEQADASIMPKSSSDDREKGKVVAFQLGVWDDIIKCRIALQKLTSACNRLPLPDKWPMFMMDGKFRLEANNVHSSVRKLNSTLLDLQSLLTEKKNSKQESAGGSDEEITSESEPEDDAKSNGTKSSMNGVENGEDNDAELSEEEDEEKDMDVSENSQKHSGRLKRKLNLEEIEETLAKRHKEYQTYRNDTLSKWDEKTRLAQGKIRSKNFAAFEMSVLKQIEQVLVNRERLVKRLHQQRTPYRILGQSEGGEEKKDEEVTVDDDDDDQDVELKLKQKTKQELPLNQEIIDDNDFYHVCLRDLIEMKQNEETDPVNASKQWLEIQRLRNKQKRKVDTRASKGRKIRYNVKEKLKNYMTPFDKSLWSDEQKDDLFKALFGGSKFQVTEQATINLGI
ncbi:protein AATF-like [Physella acuta]|uniref:protein AATF-like n=1 Tax=Physella acuta TaxID=109671 RepID=UPI0027DD5C0D|nr:protein AATF-like [Physella acuta]